PPSSSASAVTASGHAWQPPVAARLSQHVGHAAVRVSRHKIQGSGPGDLAETSGMHAPGRLKKRTEFLAVRRGTKRRGPLFLLEVLERGDEGLPRFGITVTKKVGNSV